MFQLHKNWQLTGYANLLSIIGFECIQNLWIIDGRYLFFIKEKIWNVNIFIEMCKLFFIDKRVERSSARHLPLCRLPADPWHPARACTPKQGCKTHPVWTAVWLFERDLNIPSVCPALVIEFFKQLTTLLLNLRP